MAQDGDSPQWAYDAAVIRRLMREKATLREAVKTLTDALALQLDKTTETTETTIREERTTK